jgi:hypothetical protein
MKTFLGVIGITLMLLVVAWVFAPSQTVTTRIEIDATPDAVWAVLSDFEAYETWNPFLTSIDGKMAVGETLNIHFASNAFGDMDIAPVLLNVEPGKGFRWKGMLLVPGIFDGKHFFKLEPRDGGTLLVHGESFSGLLLWAFDLNIMTDDFNAMNQGLLEEVSRRG